MSSLVKIHSSVEGGRRAGHSDVEFPEMTRQLQLQSRQQQQHQALHATMATKRPGVRPGAMLQIIWTQARTGKACAELAGAPARHGQHACLTNTPDATPRVYAACIMKLVHKRLVVALDMDIARKAAAPRYMAPPHTGRRSLDGQGARPDSMSLVSLC